MNLNGILELFKKASGVIGMAVALVVLFLAFNRLVPSHTFTSIENINTIFRQSAVVAVLAIGSAYVIIIGGIDLSVGLIAVTSSVIVALALKNNHSPAEAFTYGLIAGAVCGLVNGLFITLLRVGPFIATLSTYLIFNALALGLAHDSSVVPNHSYWIGDLMSAVPADRPYQLFPIGTWIMLAMMVFFSILLTYTRFGKHAIALGSNEQAARLCGVNINVTKLWVYTICGACSGVAGILLFARLSQGDPTAGQDFALEAIAAVVIGGGSLLGGEGSIVGSVIGSVILQTIQSGGSQMGLANWVQKLLTGAIIVVAVAIESFRLRRRENAAAGSGGNFLSKLIPALAKKDDSPTSSPVE